MRNLFLTFIFVFFSAISIAQTKYFEGVIEYSIKSESYMQGISDNEIRDRTGSILRFYFKNGNYVREYVDVAGYTLRKMFYLKDKNMVYVHNVIESPDTLYTSDAGKEEYVSYKIESGKKEKVLDYDCPSSVILVKIDIPALADTLTAVMTYFFAAELPVNPEWHKNIYVWKDVIKEHKSIAVKFIEDSPMLYKQTYTATKVTWQSVPDAVFKIDPKLVQTELK